MADSDKIITVTPNTSVATTHPEIKFVGKDNSPMYLRVLDDNTLSFEGTEGQVFSMSPTMSSGDIFSVNDISGIQSIVVNADGTVTIDAQTKSTTIKNNASNTSTLILENTNDDEVDGPILEFYRNTASPADDGDMGTLLFTGRDDAGNKQEYGRITMEFDDVSNTGEEGELIFRLTEAGSAEQEYMRLRGSSRQIEFNTGQDDIDMTWNSDTVADAMYWNAGLSKIGMGGITAPTATLEVAGDLVARRTEIIEITGSTPLSGVSNAGRLLRCTSACTVSLQATPTAGEQQIIYNDSTGTITISANGSDTINGSTNDITITSRYKAVTVIAISASAWLAIGA